MAERILEEVEVWINRHDRIQYAPPVHGGWERWAQIDFSIFMNANGIETLLEDSCYVSGQRDDLTVGPQTDPDGTQIPGAIMELKVLNGEESLTAFSAKLGKDKTKLDQPMNPNRGGFMRCSYGLAPANRLVVLLQQYFPDDHVTLANFAYYLQKVIPTHYIEQTTSANGDIFAIVFIYVHSDSKYSTENLPIV